MNKKLNEIRGSKAVVIGGSVAGLCSAAAIAPFFENVIIYERDESINNRKGIPQAVHPHVLLGAGRDAIEKLLPGFTEELVSHGSISVNLQNEMKYYLGGLYMKLHPTSDRCYFQRRHVIDLSIRNLLLKSYANVKFEWNAHVTKIERKSVTVNNKKIECDLIINASGRFSKLSDEFIVKSKVTSVDFMYSTMEFTNVISPFAGVAVLQTNNCPKGAFACRVEGTDNNVIATCFGYHDSKPGIINSVADWMDFVRTVAKPDVANYVQDATPCWDKPKTFAYKQSFYHEFVNLPCLVVGDAGCSFDPSFGQGMTKAAQQAIKIREILSKRIHVEQKDIQDVSRIPHILSTMENHRIKQISGYYPLFTPVLLPLFDKVLFAASVDDKVYDVLLKVIHLQSHPISILKVLNRIIWCNITK